jgi:hypothetical protein
MKPTLHKTINGIFTVCQKLNTYFGEIQYERLVLKVVSVSKFFQNNNDDDNNNKDIDDNANTITNTNIIACNVHTTASSNKKCDQSGTRGRAIAQVVSCQLPTAAARVQTRVWSCRIL